MREEEVKGEVKEEVKREVKGEVKWRPPVIPRWGMGDEE